MNDAQGPARATALHQRAWLLRLAALELHAADAALPAHRAALEELLTVLLLPHDAGALQMHSLAMLLHAEVNCYRAIGPASCSVCCC